MQRKTMLTKFSSGMILCILIILHQIPAFAITNFVVTMDNNRQFNVASDPLGGISGCGIETGAHSIVSQNMQANETATYSIEATNHTGNMGDPFFAIYQPSFDPGNPTTNLVACDDDSGSGGSGLYPLVTRAFTTGETFVLVTTSYDQSTSLSGTVTVNSSNDLSLIYPEMNVTGNGQSIADGDTVPSVTDDTNFGSTATTGGTVVKTFTIENTGSANLELAGSPRVSLAAGTNFAISAMPASSVSGGGSTTFQVTFNPTADGAHSDTISIVNNDSDENPYNFAITGTGTSQPEMDLSQSSTPIADGGSYGYGNQLVGSNTNIVFTITNPGGADLTLTTPLTIGGTNADQFSIQAQPSSPISSGGSTTTFTVRFSPTSTGSKTATIDIANNDSDENPYNLTITGTGTVPEIALSQSSTPIADGGSHGFGNTVIGSNTDIVFTITNTGTGDLGITTPLSVGGTDSSQFSVQAQPSSPVSSGGGTTTFTVRFTPTSLGSKTATVDITNTDSDENPYNITITGTGTAPEMDLSQNTTPIADGGTYNYGTHQLTTNTDITFTITNSGTSTLDITTPLTVGGTDSSQFSIQSQPSTTVAAGGGTTTFQVRFSPSSLGTKNGSIAITNDDNDENPYNLNITGTAINVPVVTTGTATSVTSSGATLNGEINASNSSTTATFEYGTTTSYGSTVTADQSPVSGTTNTSISKAITSLSPNTTYHFRAIGQNTAGTVNGLDATFTTTAIPPTATTNSASSVGSTTATLNGSINANNSSTVVTFEYGLTTAYGTTVTADQSPVTGVANTPVSYSLTGLLPEVTYHYRVVGQNGEGTTNGTDMTFTTSGTVPVLTTNTIAFIYGNNAISGGNVTDDGGMTITERGVCWSIHSSPTISDSCVSGTVSGSGLGQFSMMLQPLSTSTDYYVRAYAKNGIGTGYGNELTFRTALYFYLNVIGPISQSPYLDRND